MYCCKSNETAVNYNLYLFFFKCKCNKLKGVLKVTGFNGNRVFYIPVRCQFLQ